MTKSVLPAGVLDQHQIVLGKTRSGKSSVMRGIVEGLLDDEKPVCIIDPKGDWYGLKSSSTGKSAGYPVIIFGGEHADVPLNPHAGAHVAELVATGNRPCIIDLGGWMVGERTRFYIDFASNLFKLTRGRRWLVIDECHNFCPKGKIMDPDAGKMLHWSNRLASEGLGKGLHIIAASQRPQKVHNDFLTSCETIIAMRVTHPRDREAIAEWIDGCADPDIGKEVLKGLAQLPRGTGWAWSPEINFGPKQVAFPMFKTYDSFKAPTGERATRLRGWASVDLKEITAKLAVVVEEAKANDPKLLKAELAKSRRALADAEGRIRELEARPIPVAKKGDTAALKRDYAKTRKALDTAMKFITNIVATDFLGKGGIDQDRLQDAIKAAIEHAAKQFDTRLDGQRKAFEKWRSDGERMLKDIEKLLKTGEVHMDVTVRQNEPFTVAQRPAPRAQRQPSQPREPGTSMPKSERAILTVLSQRSPKSSSRSQLAILSGYSVTSSTFANAMSALRVAGYLNGRGDDNEPTQAGLDALGTYEPLPTGPDLIRWWQSRLAKSEREFLAFLVSRYPNVVSKTELAEATGYSQTSSTFANALSKLNTLELIIRQHGGDIRASETLFET